MKTLHRVKGLVHDLVVTRDGTVLTLWSPTGVRHTVLDLGAPHLPGLEYARNTLLALAFSPEAESALVLGLGGGSIPRMLLAAKPSLSIDVVEIDPVVLKVARRFFEVGSGGISESTWMTRRDSWRAAGPGTTLSYSMPIWVKPCRRSAPHSSSSGTSGAAFRRRACWPSIA